MKDKEVYVVKVLIKDHHDKINDFISGPFVRAFNKLKNNNMKKFVDANGVYLYCCLENGILHDIFTQRKIDADEFTYEIVPSSDLTNIIKGLSKEEIGMVDALIKKFIFGDDIHIDFVNVLSMEELASDRALMFKDYNNGLSLINPYEVGHESDYNKSLVDRLLIEKVKKESSEKGKKRR